MGNEDFSWLSEGRKGRGCKVFTPTRNGLFPPIQPIYIPKFVYKYENYISMKYLGSIYPFPQILNLSMQEFITNNSFNNVYWMIQTQLGKFEIKKRCVSLLHKFSFTKYMKHLLSLCIFNSIKLQISSCSLLFSYDITSTLK